MILDRRTALSVLAGGAAAPALAAPAIAQDRIEWRMVTSWPKNLPGPGTSAQMLADLISSLSGGRLNVKLYAAGELVPALEVFDAVASGTAQMAHTAPLFWSGKFPAAAFFTAAPFGLTPLEHMTWIMYGGGQQLWDELYAPFGIKPFMAGNTGFQMGGWFRRKITSVEDLRGLKMRIPGLGGLALKRLGALPVTVAPGEIFTALETGVIDATEFLGPYSDMAMGFFRVAPYYYYPGWHEPNGTGEALVSATALASLPQDLQAVVEAACAVANVSGLAESEWQNAGTLETLLAMEGVSVLPFPGEVLDALRQANEEAMLELVEEGGITARIVRSYRAAATHQGRWSDISVRAFLDIRA
jgi:TRAP-type mannitol/chloroaromatic compound transport system substrate-binding protein